MSSEHALRRALIKLLALAAGGLACNLPARLRAPEVTTPPAPMPSSVASVAAAPSPVQSDPPSAPTVTVPPLTEPAAPTLTPVPIPYLLVDAHCDAAWNWLEFGRDPRESAYTTRAREAGQWVEAVVGQRTTGLPEWLAGRVGVIFATLFVAPQRRALSSGATQVYATPAEAHQHAADQIAAYHNLVAADPRFRLIRTRGDLEAVVQTWGDDAQPAARTVGLLVSMEGADPIEEPAQVRQWYAQGLRAVGPAWVATRYAGGTGEPGPLTDLGRALLDEMADLGMILDLSHIAEEAFLEAVDSYPGPMIASHSNPRAFLPTDRGLSDEMIGRLVARGGIIGIVLYNRYLKPGWDLGDPRSEVTLATVAQAIDYIVQLTGSVAQVGLGSDFDGGFGMASIPDGMESIADLGRVAEALAAMGYGDQAIRDILGGNWLRLLRASLPE